MLMIEDGVNKVTDEELAEAVAYYSSDQVQQYIKVNFEETELNQYTTRDGITIFLPTQYAIQSKLENWFPFKDVKNSCTGEQTGKSV